MSQLMIMQLDGKSFMDIKRILDSTKRTAKCLEIIDFEMNDKSD